MSELLNEKGKKIMEEFSNMTTEQREKIVKPVQADLWLRYMNTLPENPENPYDTAKLEIKQKLKDLQNS